MSSTKKSFVKRCSKSDIFNLLVRMVRAPSHPGILRQEEGVVRELDAFFKKHTIETNIVEVREGRPNLIASITGSSPGPHLLLCGHTDTVPPNEQSSEDPFAAIEKNGRLYGRGTVDMKGAVAAMAGALTAIKKSGGLKAGKITLAAVIDEEMESLGAESLILSGFRADASIVGEPTNNRIAIGHKGLEWLRIDFEGRAAHGGTPEAGINSISAAASFVRMVEEDLIPEFKNRLDPILGPPAINMGTISGGDQPSTVAAHCRIELDRRWVMTETIEMVFEDLDGLLEMVRKKYPGLKTRVSRVPQGMATMFHGPITIDSKHPVVQAAQRAMQDFDLQGEALTILPAWTDGALLSREAKIPSIIWGPGDLKLAHTPEESIELEDVATAAELYAAASLYFTRSI